MKLRTPQEITDATLAIGQNKTGLSTAKTILQSIQAGAFIALGGILSIMIGYGFPEITAANPAMQRLLSGIMFPVGLILTVCLGAELFTGNNALLMPGLIRRDFGWTAVVRNWTLVYLGNFIGAIAFAYIMVYAAGLTTPEPWHSAVIRCAETKTSLPWDTVFIRAIGANWCVCLAVWLALSGHTLIDKIAGCFIPVMAFVILGYEHCIANMFFIPLGMMEGADVTPATFVTANLIPATLGNILGGALFVGSLSAWLHLKNNKK